MTLQATPAVGTRQEVRVSEGQPGWLVVAEQECRDLWSSGRGLILLFLVQRSVERRNVLDLDQPSPELS